MHRHRPPGPRLDGGGVSPEMQVPKLMWLKRHLPDILGPGRPRVRPRRLPAWRATGNPARSSARSPASGPGSPTEPPGWQAISSRRSASRTCRHAPGCPTRPPGRRRLGPLTPAAAADLGLTPAARVAAGLIDAHAGALGVLGLRRAGVERRAALVAGTSTCVMAFGRAARCPRCLGTLPRRVLPGLWMVEGGQSASGALLDHLSAVARPRAGTRRRMPRSSSGYAISAVESPTSPPACTSCRTSTAVARPMPWKSGRTCRWGARSGSAAAARRTRVDGAAAARVAGRGRAAAAGGRAARRRPTGRPRTARGRAARPEIGSPDAGGARGAREAPSRRSRCRRRAPGGARPAGRAEVAEDAEGAGMGVDQAGGDAGARGQAEIGAAAGVSGPRSAPTGLAGRAGRRGAAGRRGRPRRGNPAASRRPRRGRSTCRRACRATRRRCAGGPPGQEVGQVEDAAEPAPRRRAAGASATSASGSHLRRHRAADMVETAWPVAVQSVGLGERRGGRARAMVSQRSSPVAGHGDRPAGGVADDERAGGVEGERRRSPGGAPASARAARMAAAGGLPDFVAVTARRGRRRPRRRDRALGAAEQAPAASKMPARALPVPTSTAATSHSPCGAGWGASAAASGERRPRARMSSMTASGREGRDRGAVRAARRMAPPGEGHHPHAGGLRRRMPAGLSSTTRQAGEHAPWTRGVRKRSGAGLPRATIVAREDAALEAGPEPGDAQRELDALGLARRRRRRTARAARRASRRCPGSAAARRGRRRRGGGASRRAPRRRGEPKSSARISRCGRAAAEEAVLGLSAGRAARPARRASRAGCACAIGSLSTSTPSQSKMTRPPAPGARDFDIGKFRPGSRADRARGNPGRGRSRGRRRAFQPALGDAAGARARPRAASIADLRRSVRGRARRS